MKLNHTAAQLLATLALTAVAAPCYATSDAAMEAAPPDRDASIDDEPAPPDRDAAVEDDPGPPLPDGRLETIRACAAVRENVGSQEAPTRLTFDVDAPWAHSLSEIRLSADLPGGEIPPDQVFARVVGEAWVPFSGVSYTDVAFEGECPEDSACDAILATLNGTLPALSRVPAPFVLEVALLPETFASFSELCLVVTAFESETPGPLIVSSPDEPGTDHEVDAFYDFWEDAPDAGGGSNPDDNRPLAKADALPAIDTPDASSDPEPEPETDPNSETPVDTEGEQSGCSTTTSASGPLGALFLLLLPLGLTRRRRG